MKKTYIKPGIKAFKMRECRQLCTSPSNSFRFDVQSENDEDTYNDTGGIFGTSGGSGDYGGDGSGEEIW